MQGSGVSLVMTHVVCGQARGPAVDNLPPAFDDRSPKIDHKIDDHRRTSSSNMAMLIRLVIIVVSHVPRAWHSLACRFAARSTGSALRPEPDVTRKLARGSSHCCFIKLN